MFTINIYLRFALIGLGIIGGSLLWSAYGFWYGFPFLLVGTGFYGLFLAGISSFVAAVREADASLGAAEADAERAEVDLRYTVVKAPISGRISDRKVDAGNLIQGGQTGATIERMLDQGARDGHGRDGALPDLCHR